MNKASEHALQMFLEASGGAMLTKEVSNGQNGEKIRFTLRVPDRMSAAWASFMLTVLSDARDKGQFNLDISRFYYVQSAEAGPAKLLYTWRVILDGTENFVAALGAQPSVEEDPPYLHTTSGEVPIIPSSSRMGRGPNGKGAKPKTGF